jgi:hypothetical protein
MPVVEAAAAVTDATGGSAISAITVGGTFTSLTGPAINEGSTGDIGVGTIILNAPAGFEFDTGGTAPTVQLTGGSGTASKNTNHLANNAIVAVDSVSSTQITFTITFASNTGEKDKLTWLNVRVRPTSASLPLASGNITKSGSSTIAGVTGSTNFGTLTETGVIVTLATGGSAVDAGTVGGSFTSLTGPIIEEDNSFGEIGVGTLILNVPSGFEFDTGGTAPVVKLDRTHGSGPNSCNINGAADNSQLSVTSYTTTQITFTVISASTDAGSCSSTIRNKLTWQNVRVRPTASSPFASGDLLISGTSLVVGVGGSTNFGTLTEVGVTITLATGGSAISAATVGGAFTTLTGPVLAENATGDIGENGAGTIILNAPSGFEFDTGGTAPTVLITRIGGSGADNRNINDRASGYVEAITSRSTTQITFTVAHETSNGVTNSLTWQNIRVRPTAAAPLASGDILKTGVSTIVGVGSSTNLGTLTEVAAAGTTVTELASSLNPSTYGDSVTFTALVKHGSSPSGTVTFMDGVTSLGTGTLGSITATGATATFATSTLSVSGSPHSITAVYGGDGSNSGSTSVALSQTVNQIATTTALGSSTNPSMSGSSVTFTATVTGNSPSGTVLFKDGGTTIGSGSLAGGVTTFSTSGLSGGGATHSITAHYLGDANNAASDSSAVSQVVNTLPNLTVTTIVNNTHGGTETPSSVAIFVDGTPVTSGTAAKYAEGIRTVSQTLPTGYTGVIGGDCASDGTITVAINEVKSCTVTDADTPAHINVIKSVTNDNGGTLAANNFNITVTGTNASPASFAGTSGTDVTLDAGSYSVAETAVTGYAGSYSSDCTGTIAVGESKTCTITNDDVAPKLTVTKVVVNDNGGTEVITNFPLYVDSGSVTSGVQITTTIGLHTVSEASDPGYTDVITGDCASDGTITLALGDVKSCIITNNDKPAHLNVIKNVTNDNGGTLTSGDFSITVTGNSPSPASFAGSSTAVDVTIDAGSYSVAEGSVYGYSGTLSTDCVGSILPGETKTCTITNDDVAPKLTVTKVVTNDNGGTKVVADFPLFIDSTSVTSGVQTVLNAGTYTVSETSLTTYAAAITGDCATDGTITLVVGDVKSCTITNDDIAPKLTVIKKVVNDDGGTYTSTGFTLTVDDQIVTTGSGTSLNVGTYHVGEVEDIGYSFSYSGDCDLTNGTISLGLGETKTCTITNNDRGGFFFSGGQKQNAGAGGAGSNVNRFGNAVNFVLGSRGPGGGGVPSGAFGGGPNVPLSQAEKDLLCSIRKLRPETDTGILSWVAEYVGAIIGRDPDTVMTALLDASTCGSSQAMVPQKKVSPVAVHVDRDGYVVSTHPVWNACTSAKGLTLELIRSNTDKVEQRDGNGRPMTCADYHKNDVNLWNHPDYPGLQVQLNNKGKLIGDLPTGYIVKRDTAVAQTQN